MADIPDESNENWAMTGRPVQGAAGAGFFESFPQQGACYAVHDRSGRRVHLGTTSRFRQALEKSLGDPAVAGEVAEVRWRAVFSRFEADSAYLENLDAGAEETDLAAAMRRWECHWLVLEESGSWPCWRVGRKPPQDAARCFGPFASRPRARAVQEEIEDLFDLCREHSLLVQAPRAAPCSYKAMEKCSSACDGSVDRAHYLEQVRRSQRCLEGEKQAVLGILEERMRRAAGSMQYEEAETFRKKMESFRRSDHPFGNSIRPMRELGWLSLQRDRSRNFIRAFAAGAGGIHPLGRLEAQAEGGAIPALLQKAEQVFSGMRERPIEGPLAGCRVSLAAWHAGRTGRGCGVLIDRVSMNEPAIREALEKFIPPVAEAQNPRADSEPAEEEIEER